MKPSEREEPPVECIEGQEDLAVGEELKAEVTEVKEIRLMLRQNVHICVGFSIDDRIIRSG